jgi:putative transposase
MSILGETNEQFERTLLLKSRGHILTTIAERIAALYRMNRDDVLSKGRQTPRVEVRSVLCYFAVRDLKLSVTHLERLVGMTPFAISYAVARGKKIADEKGIRLAELLNNWNA